MRRAGEEGVALLTVLLLVAVMATLAVALLDDIRFSLRRTANAEAVGQARWYAIGAETLAKAQIARLSAAGGGRTTLQGGWHGRVLRFPIEGGTIQARVTDGAACFNLNSVVQGAGEVLERRDAGVRQFIALTQALGAPDGERLAAALVDWIDTDVLRESGGAEDEAYVDGGWLTAATLLAEPSELRAVRGFEPAIYERLRPYVCALPTAELSPINVNTLPPEKAVLLTMLTEGRLPLAGARRIIEGRPPFGWASPSEFWNEPALQDAAPSDEAVGQVEVRTRFFELETEVAYLDAEVTASALLEDQGGRVRLVSRRWGPEE
ncbi:type II secretion system minor pseudopilin GspK [Phenylobacterium terrae]|uniref:Type II secretion system protein K n=1 Tax=Phenylobacterium terrae TaxID=2665495 RepID=A0ABW4N4H8_9CAUL